MKISLCAALSLAVLSMATPSFAGPTGSTGTPASAVSTDGSVGSMAMSGSSGGSSGIEILPPSGGKGGYPARESNGCSAPGTPQDTGSSIGFGC